jgi:hypothetical protein
VNVANSAAEVSEQLVAEWMVQHVASFEAEWIEDAALVGFADNIAAAAVLFVE